MIAGTAGCGTVFKLTHNPDGTWTNTTLWEFHGGSDGAVPYAGVVLDQAGNVYGVSNAGGIGTCNYNRGCGSIYKLSPSGSGWVETTLHEFTGETDGGSPYGGLTFDSAGSIYGAAAYGGVGLGTVYELTPNHGSWSFSVIYAFTGTQADGPESALTMDAAGNLYGTSLGGGDNGGFGTVYKLTPSGAVGLTVPCMISIFKAAMGGWSTAVWRWMRLAMCLASPSAARIRLRMTGCCSRFRRRGLAASTGAMPRVDSSSRLPGDVGIVALRTFAIN